MTKYPNMNSVPSVGNFGWRTPRVPHGRDCIVSTATLASLRSIYSVLLARRSGILLCWIACHIWMLRMSARFRMLSGTICSLYVVQELWVQKTKLVFIMAAQRHSFILPIEKLATDHGFPVMKGPFTRQERAPLNRSYSANGTQRYQGTHTLSANSRESSSRPRIIRPHSS